MEAQILLWIQNNMRHELLNPVVEFITNLGYFIWVVLAVLFLFFKSTRKLGITTCTSIALDLLLVNAVVKNIVGRVRPYEVIDGLVSIVGEQSDKSFPSGHTAIAFAFVAVLWFLAPKKVSIPLTVFAVVIAFSRMYIGVHYPTDILGGIVFGIICAVVSIKLVNFVKTKIEKKKESQ